MKTANLTRFFVAGKTGSGADAVALAREGKWDELAEYCMQDTKKTYQVSSLQYIMLPQRGDEPPVALCLTGRKLFVKLAVTPGHRN